MHYQATFEEMAHKRELLQAECDLLTELELERVKPLIAEAKAKREARELGAKQEKEAAEAAQRSERLKTGVLTLDMTRGDRRLWGEPWIAKVQRSNGQRPEYDFSQGSYDLATETLSIPCKPGEVIAYGQKNFRKPKDTIHRVQRMLDDGSMVEA